MHPMITSVLVALLPLALASGTTLTPKPASSTTTCTNTLCADYVNSCGQTYGGCYPACPGLPTPSFTDPGCPKSISKKPVTTTTTKPTTTKAPTTSCTNTLCADYINSCGQTYGGCYPACPGLPTPSFTDPGCPTSISKKPVTTSTTKSTKKLITSKPTTSSCTNTLCADYINSCGQTYGGCYPACPGLPTPTFTDPGCPTPTSISKKSIKTSTKKPTTTTKPTTTKPPTTSCTNTLCADYINSCGQTYGGCYPACPGLSTPTFTDPGCPTLTSSSKKTTKTSSCPYVCQDYFDDCGNTYGPGCFTSCTGQAPPSFTTPYCPVTGSMTIMARETGA